MSSAKPFEGTIRLPTHLQQFLDRWHQHLFFLAHYPHSYQPYHYSQSSSQSFQSLQSLQSSHVHLKDCMEYESAKACSGMLRPSFLLQLKYGDSIELAKDKVLQTALNSIFL